MLARTDQLAAASFSDCARQVGRTSAAPAARRRRWRRMAEVTPEMCARPSPGAGRRLAGTCARRLSCGWRSPVARWRRRADGEDFVISRTIVGADRAVGFSAAPAVSVEPRGDLRGGIGRGGLGGLVAASPFHLGVATSKCPCRLRRPAPGRWVAVSRNEIGSWPGGSVIEQAPIPRPLVSRRDRERLHPCIGVAVRRRDRLLTTLEDMGQRRTIS